MEITGALSSNDLKVLYCMMIFSRFLFEYSNTHINSLSRKIVVFIYFFHMQSFVFISGFFLLKIQQKYKMDLNY